MLLSFGSLPSETLDPDEKEVQAWFGECFPSLNEEIRAAAQQHVGKGKFL